MNNDKTRSMFHLVFADHRQHGMEDRVQSLETQLPATQNTLCALVKRLDEIHARVFDGDSKVG